MNERSIKKMLLVTIVLSVMVLASFSVLSGNAAAATPKSASEGDTLVVAFQQDIPNLNYFDLGTNTVWKSDAIGWGWDTLMSYTPDLQVYLNMAESYTVDTPDGLNVTVKIRKGITFHDGVEMTADDVVFTYDVLCYNPLFESNLVSLKWPDARWKLYDGVGSSHVGVEKIDDYTVAFHLYEPYPLFYHIILNEPILPLHIWKDHLKSAGTGDSDDVTIDTSFGKDASEAEATIGTGPFKFVDWRPGAYVIVERYDNYWGKNFTVRWQGKEWSMFPKNIKRIEFKIYNTLDTAVLALQKGEVHYIDWTIPPGYYNQLKTDPNIGFSIVDDQGFFYLAFNMRKAPMNDLAFRTAVAHCIDKDYIVTTLLQGYGTKGTVPISITSGAYINTSAIPPDFDLEAAKQVLESHGYKDVNGDGWREAPDGSPIKETILTPPKDYDPVRAEAGIMIQSNLQKVGLNIQSSPTDFDTIVSKAFVQVSFDMYILGWAVGSFPETYLKDFFYSKYAAPVGNNAPGYSNPKVDELLDEIDHEMDTQKRIKLVKDVEGILVHDLPYDVLYYRKNIMGYRKDIWTGWVPAFGTIYNMFSLGALKHGVSGGEKPEKPVEVSEEYNGVKIHAYMPTTVYAGREIKGIIYVTDNDNVPIPDAPVIVNAADYAVNGSTDENGVYQFSIPLKYANYGTLPVYYSTAVKIGGKTYIDKGVTFVEVLYPKHIAYLTLSMNKTILTPGEKATITAKVVDIDGSPLSGIDVNILTQEVSGEVSPTSQTTNESGVATFQYTAPEKIPAGTNPVDIVKAVISVENTVATASQSATLFVPIQTTGHADWYRVKVVNVTEWGIEKDETTNITVQVVYASNDTPVKNVKVSMQALYSYFIGDVITLDDWAEHYEAKDYNVSGILELENGEDWTVPVNDSGMATFQVKALKNVNRPYILEFNVYHYAYSLSDSVEIFVGNETEGCFPNLMGEGENSILGNYSNYENNTGTYLFWKGIYGLHLEPSVTTTSFGEDVSVKVTVYNATTNAPEPNATGYVTVLLTDVGAGVETPAAVMDYVTDENGTAVVDLGSTLPIRVDQPVTITGWITSNFFVHLPDGNITPLEDYTSLVVGTEVVKNEEGENETYLDLWLCDGGFGEIFGYAIFAYPYFSDGLGYLFVEDAAFDYPAYFGAVTKFVLYRAPIMGIKDISITPLVATDSQYIATVSFTVVGLNETGAEVPLEGVDVSVGYAIGSLDTTKSSSKGGHPEFTRETTTDENGHAEVNVLLPPQLADTVATYSIMLSSSDHAMELNYEFVQPYIFQPEKLRSAVGIDSIEVKASDGGVVVPYGGSATISLRVVGGKEGKPLEGATVSVVVPAGEVDSNTKQTDANGNVSFTFTPPEKLVPSHYVIMVTVQAGGNTLTQFIGVEVKGEYNSSTEMYKEKSQQLEALQTNYTTLKSDYDSLKEDYENLENQKKSATTLEYVFLALFIIFLILTPVMYIVGKRSAASKVEEEPVEEPTEEESEETSEEEISEEGEEEKKEE